MATLKSLDERVDPLKVRSGSFIVPSSDGDGFEIVQPGEPMFSTATFVAAAFVEADGSLTKIEQDVVEKEPHESPVFVASIICTKMYVNCPHCEEQQDGWVGDPRGESYTCTSCKKTFIIPYGCQITIQ